MEVLKAPNRSIDLNREEIDWSLKWKISPKLDGNRGIIVGDRLLTSRMKVPKNINLRNLLEPLVEHCSRYRMFVDYEVYIHDQPQSIVASFCNSKAYLPPVGLTINVFDGGPLDALEDQCKYLRFIDRIDFYTKIVQKVQKKCPKLEQMLKAIEQVPVDGKNQAYNLFNHYLTQGYEGAILRAGEIDWSTGQPIGGWYKHGRATYKQQIAFKLKANLFATAVVVEMHEAYSASGRALGMLGALTVDTGDCVSKIGLGKGFDHDLRRKLWKEQDLVERQVQYEYLSVGGIEDGKIRHGRLVRIYGYD